MNKIAQTIIDQINEEDPLAFRAWGAKNMVAMRNGLKFTTSGRAAWKGHVYIKINPEEGNYDVDFFRITPSVEITYDDRRESLDVDDLVIVIDEVVR